MQHLEEGTIHAWLDGALDAEESARVEQHARECADCAAAVAEARGLVAGATRILGALDQVPAGVTPRSAASGGGSPMTERSRSLWGRLHLTPLRAAAAALVFLAAGSVLVVRSTPNADKAAMSLDTAGTVRNTPLPNAAAQQTSPMASTAPQAAAGEKALPEARAAALPPAALSRPRYPSRREGGAMRTEVATGSGAEGRAARPSVSAADSVSVAAAPRAVAAESAPMRDSLSTREVRALEAKRSAVVGGVAPSTAAPQLSQVAQPTAAPARAYANLAAQTPVPSYVGCYAVTADSAAALPQQLALDSTRAVSLGDAAAGVSGRVPRATVAKPVDVSHTVSALFGNARQPLSNASWQPLASGGVRLSVDSPTRTLLLQPTAPNVLTGSTTVSGRVLPVTLRRVECR